MKNILGIVKRGSQNSRVVFYENGDLYSGRVSNQYLLVRFFPSGVETAVRLATDSDKAHILEMVTVKKPVRVCGTNARVDGVIFKNQTKSVLVPKADAVPNKIVEIEQRFFI